MPSAVRTGAAGGAGSSEAGGLGQSPSSFLRELVLVRARVVASDGKDAVEEAARAARAVVAGGASIDEVTGAIVAVWRACDGLDDGNPLQLPRFYGSDATVALLKRIVGSLRSCPKATTAGSMILNGVVGVGKTTMLRAAAIMGFLVFDVFCFFWDFSDQQPTTTSPIGVMRRQLREVLDVEAGMPTNEAPLVSEHLDLISRAVADSDVAKAHSFTGGIAVLFDEVNAIYTAADVSWAKGCIQELLQVGKRPQWIGVLTGSASRLREMVFCLDEAWARWPNLNHSVYIVHCVFPVRSHDEMAAYYSRRFEVAEADVPALLFSATGGVGRLADVAHTTDNVLDALIADRDATVCKAMESLGYQRLASLFVVQNEAKLDHDGKLADPAYVPHVSRAEANMAGLTTAQLTKWVDAGLFFLPRESGVAVELLCPIDLQFMAAWVRRNQEARLVHTLRAATRAYKSGSAGADLEVPLLTWLGQRQLGCEFDGALVMSGGVHYIRHPDGSRSKLSDLGPAGLLGKVYQRSQDHGVDAWLLKQLDSTTYALEGLHIKTGFISERGPGKFTPGARLARLRAKAWVTDAAGNLSTNISRFDASNQLHAVIAKAEVGLILLRDILLSILPEGTTVALGGVRLWTTKEVDADVVLDAGDIEIGGPAARADIPASFACTGLDILAGEAFWAAVGEEVRIAL